MSVREKGYRPPSRFVIRKNRETGKWELFSKDNLSFHPEIEYTLAAKFKSQQKAIKYLTKIGMI